MNISTLSPVREFVTSIQVKLQERAESAAAKRALEQELASYRTSRDIEDLLGTIQNEDSAEAQQIRDILLDNLRTKTQSRAA